MENVFDDSLTIRVNKNSLDVFKKKSDDLGKPYQMLLREVIEAFNQDRLRIILTDEQKESLKIYHKEN